jgi:hypothetical protein
MFKELLSSVKEMNRIVKGKKKPARIFKYQESEVKAI